MCCTSTVGRKIGLYSTVQYSTVMAASGHSLTGVRVQNTVLYSETCVPFCTWSTHGAR